MVLENNYVMRCHHKGDAAYEQKFLKRVQDGIATRVMLRMRKVS